MILQLFLCLLSVGLWPIILYWNPKILKDVIYDETKLEDASHFYVLFKSK